MTYKRGDRIVLVHTTDPHTNLTEGDEAPSRDSTPTSPGSA